MKSISTGDLVRYAGSTGGYGVVVDFNVRYNKYGEPVEKLAIVSWSDLVKPQPERFDELEVMNEMGS